MSWKILVTIMVLLSLFAGYRAGIRHAMMDSAVSVYIDGRVELELDGDVYEHRAF